MMLRLRGNVASWLCKNGCWGGPTYVESHVKLDKKWPIMDTAHRF